MDELYQQIINTYQKTNSINKTAEQLGTYPIKVRRVLITEGLWKSRTSESISKLLAEGKTVPEIAKELMISEKNVQSYMPYSRGQYGGSDKSNDAIRSGEYRERMQNAAKNQVKNTEARSKKYEAEQEEIRRLQEEIRALKAETERFQKEHNEFWNSVEADIKRCPVALQLHLELDLGYFAEEDKVILQRYGRMEEGISRDFIVPGTMTLHGLHYAIMKAFGWQNSHLHSYVPYMDEFKKMTNGGLVKEWTRQVGMYFRFPSGNYEDFYWDDDYEEGESIKSWLKSKYCGPYLYEGVEEHYIPAQIEVDRFRKECPDIQKKTTDQRTWNLYMDGQCEEMLERSKIWTVLRTPSEPEDWDGWKKKKETALKQVEKERKELISRYKKLSLEMDQVVEKAEACFDPDGKPTMEMLAFFEEIERIDKELERLCRNHNPEPIPALSALCYRYDYGDGWEIRITCTNAWYDHSIYKRDDHGRLVQDRNGFVPEKPLFTDAFEQQTEGEFLEKLLMIARKEKPVCIAWDGMNVVDDAGGVSGFCEFLEVINGDNQEEKRNYKEWAKSLGWTGRMSKPENML